MYLRTKKVKASDGKIYEYEQLVESCRRGKSVKQRVVMTLGQKGAIPPERIQEIVRNLIQKDPTLQLMRSLDKKTPDVKIHWSKQYGSYYVFRSIWKQLGLEDILMSVAPKKKDGQVFTEMVFIEALSRLDISGSSPC